jgi:two-component system cell cycle sensor histidine kinase/response regulator CckA
MPTAFSRPGQLSFDWFFTHSPDLVGVVGVDGVVRRVNPAFEAILGYTASELRGFSLTALVHPADRDATAAALAALHAAEPASGFENRMCCRDGSERWISWRATAADDAGEYYVIGRDVTRSYLHGLALAANDARCRALLANASELIVVSAADGSTRYTSPNVERMLGYTPDEYAALDPREIIHPDDVERSMAVFQALAGRPGDSVQQEQRVRHKDGSWRTYAVSAHNLLHDPDVRGVVLNGRDVTGNRVREAALRDSEARFRALFEQTAVPIGISSLDGRQVMSNAALQRFLGYSAAELMRLRFTDYTHPEDATDSVDSFARLVSGQPESYVSEKRYVRKDRRTVWGRLTLTLIRDRSGQPLLALAVVEDITDRKRAERALKESREFYRSVVEDVEQVIFRANQDGRWTFLSPAWMRVTGYELADSLGRVHREFVHPDDRESLNEAFGPLESGEQEQLRHELRYVAKNGEPVWIEVRARAVRGDQGQLVGTAGTLTDITARRRAEDALRTSEERFRLAAQATDDVIYDWDLPTGSLTWSDAIYTTFGYEPHSVVAHIDWWSAQLHEDDAERVHVSLQQLKASGGGSWASEYRFRCGDGTYAHVLERGTLICAADGTPLRMVGSLLDLTERLRLEERLRQAQKMDAVGRLAGGVAHDFNNLLTVIGAHAELLRESLSPDTQDAEDLDEIQKATSRAAALTHQLLAFSRQQVVAPRTLDLNATVANVEKMLRRLIGEDIAFSTTLQRGAGSILADAGQVEQVIVNLVVNARDAMPDGGELIIETGSRLLSAADLSAHPTVPPGPFVVLRVCDTGCGMDEATRARIFEPFFTTKAVGRGTGLGLATVYGIVEQSGGFITVESAPGAGATFCIYMPRVSTPAEDALAAVDPERLFGSETILVAEDEDSLRALIGRILGRHGYRVLSAANGRAALELAAAEPGRIDLVLTDAVMPLLGGPELVRQLSPLRPAMRVLYMTGYSDSDVLRRGLLDASAELMQKPFSTVQLLRAVRDALDGGAGAAASGAPVDAAGTGAPRT